MDVTIREMVLNCNGLTRSRTCAVFELSERSMHIHDVFLQPV